MTTEHEAAQHVCTPAELDAWTLRHQGLSRRQISLALRISPSAVRDRLFNADRKIANHLETQEPAA